MRRLFSRRALLLVGALFGFGCYSPTLPLPPPLTPEITATEDGLYQLHGGVLPDAQVFALNSRTLLVDGQQADHVGLYRFVLHDAQAGDGITFWYEAGTDLSPSMVFELPDLASLGSPGAGGTSGSTANAGASGAAAAAGSGGIGGAAGSGT